MQVALPTEFAVTKKEPLAVLLERIHAAFLASGLGEIQSPAGLAAELVGGPRARRCWRGNGRAWIEVRGLSDPQ